MATKLSQSEMECTCPVCCDIFNDPVVLLCGHSFCNCCLQEWWKQSCKKTCPVCKEIFPMPQPPRNLALKNLSEALRQEKSQASPSESKELCDLHGEKRKLFCQNDQMPICLVCRESKAHKKHSCVPINEAADEYRAKLKSMLVNFQSKLGSYERVKLTCDKMAAHLQLQAQQTEKKIGAEFEKLYQFLRAEEAARIDACRTEATLRRKTMNGWIFNFNSKIVELQRKVKTIQEELGAEDISFLLNVRTTMEGPKCRLTEPNTPSGALMEEAKHVGNLQFTVWKKMADIIQYTPVTLDPNTSCLLMSVSENLTRSTQCEECQPLPFNPERLRSNGVLGYEGITSGKHSWDVEVSGRWAVGVAAKTKDKSREKIWAIYICVCTNILRELTPVEDGKQVTRKLFPEKVRVKLDYDQGILTFLDLGRNKPVHTIKSTFTETLFPYFCESANILPAEFSVNTKMWKYSKAK